MKKIVFLFLVFSTKIIAQNHSIDSLRQVLESIPENNKERVQLLNELAFQYHYKYPDSGLLRAKQALTLAILLKNTEQQGLAYKHVAYNYETLSRYPLAETYYDSAIVFLKKHKYWNQAGRASYNKGRLLSSQGEFKKALESQITAYLMFEKDQDSILMSVALNGKGVNQMYLSMYPEAIKTYLNSIQLLEKLGRSNTGNYADICSNLGLIYNRLEDYDVALSYYNQSQEINEKLLRDVPRANVLLNMGNIYDNLNQSEKAITFYKKSLAIMIKEDNTYGIASAYTNMGVANISLNKFDKALHFLELAKSLLETLEDSYNLSIVYDNIGDIYKKQSETNEHKKLLLKAKRNYEKALFYANKINALSRKADIYKRLSEVNGALKNFKLAYDQQQQANQFKDSVISRENKEQIAQLEASHEYEKKELKLKSDFEKSEAIKEAEIARQKLIGQIYLGSAVVVLIVIGIVIQQSNQKRKIRAIAKENEFKKDIAESKLIALRTQLNPHFIFNAMNSIEQYMSTHGTEKASDYLIKFSTLMRRILQSSEKNWITVKEEMDLMRVYVEIESLRLRNSVQLSVDIDKRIDPENTLVPSLFIQPLIENSIKHGISKKEDDGMIKISIEETDEQLICTVEDNGIGRHASASQNKEYKSMGMNIAKERINYINQLTNNNSSFEIQDLEEGLRTTITIPHKKLF